MSDSKEQQLWESSTSGHLDLVKCLASDPGVNVNWIGPERGDTSLHRACRFGHLQVVEILIKHPMMDVNAGNVGKATSFNIACQEGFAEVVKLLMADTRVDLNTPNKR